MTASRPATPATVRYNQNHQVNPSNNVLAKRTRGPINKRACQRCRQGKIKCDGDAETGKPCSNCDPQHCKYDNSPRKNKQVESLKTRLSEVENQLVNITRDVYERLMTKDLEKEILCRLYETRHHFINSKQENLFHELKEALKESRCMRPILAITGELLNRLAIDNNENFIPDIMKSLERFVTMLPTDPSDDVYNKKIENYCQPGTQPFSANDMVILQQQPLQPLDNSQVLNMPSTDDSASSAYDYEDPETTPPLPSRRLQQQQQIDSETKCYNGSNNVTHNVQDQTMIGTSTGSDYSTTFAYNGENMYPYYSNSEYVVDNYQLYLMNEPQTTTSPTDEPQMSSSWQ